MKRKASRSEPLIKQIINDTFPDYKGRKIMIMTEFPRDLVSYWSGGTMSYYIFYQPNSRKTFEVDHLTQPHKQHQENRDFTPDMIPDSVILVEHAYFCGHDMGLRIYVKKPDQLQLEGN